MTNFLRFNLIVRSLFSVFRNQDSGQHSRSESGSFIVSQTPSRFDTPSPDAPSPQLDASPAVGSGSPAKKGRLSSRPESTFFSSVPPLADIGGDTPPEMQPIFSLLNSHANKLYHEGYFLKLNDLDTCRSPVMRFGRKDITDLRCRWSAVPGSTMGGMLCATRRNCPNFMGCSCAGRSWGGWRSASNVYQLGRCVYKNGMALILLATDSILTGAGDRRRLKRYLQGISTWSL